VQAPALESARVGPSGAAGSSPRAIFIIQALPVTAGSALVMAGLTRQSIAMRQQASVQTRADPVIAIATPPGRGAVGIVRLSGPELSPLIVPLCGRPLLPRQATYLPLRDHAGEVIDRGLAINFPAPHSYTGEHVLELQVHGGPVVLQLLLARCLALAAETDDNGRPRLPRLRLARPGEFTERAFLNDKLDLAQAESVADLIDAGTEAAARSAARSLDGAFSSEIRALAERLLDLRVLVEATLDFPEEELDFLERADALGRLEAIRAALAAVRSRARMGALLRDGLKVVLAGQPNVGKSSLLNALAGAELAIVTAVPGTTRDKVSQTIQIDGVPIHVVDTAGLRATDEEVERIGVHRSWAEIAGADAVLMLHDLTRRGDADYAAADAAIAAQLGDAARVIPVFNKADLQRDDAPLPLPLNALVVSALTGHGLPALRAELLRRAGWQAGHEGLFMARARHLQALHDSAAHVDAALALAARRDAALDLLAEELRLAHRALGAIVGEVDADQLLGEIFGRFCIGK
jgi:tRNA modification GTPase